MNRRILTISKVSRSSGGHGRSGSVASIRLTGKWLERLGFVAGERISVEGGDGSVVLRLVEQNENANAKEAS